jgi:hypothetical protein
LTDTVARPRRMTLHYDLSRMILNWEPPSRPACSNCANCRVYGNADAPLVYCSAGHGQHGEQQQQVELGRVIREKRPIGFRAAASCPDFDDMGGPS